MNGLPSLSTTVDRSTTMHDMNESADPAPVLVAGEISTEGGSDEAGPAGLGPLSTTAAMSNEMNVTNTITPATPVPVDVEWHCMAVAAPEGEGSWFAPVQEAAAYRDVLQQLVDAVGL